MYQALLEVCIFHVDDWTAEWEIIAANATSTVNIKVFSLQNKYRSVSSIPTATDICAQYQNSFESLDHLTRDLIVWAIGPFILLFS